MKAQRAKFLCVVLAATIALLASCATPVRITTLLERPPVAISDVVLLPEPPASDSYEVVGYVAAKGYSVAEVRDVVLKRAAAMGGDTTYLLREDHEGDLVATGGSAAVIASYREFTFKVVRRENPGS